MVNTSRDGPAERCPGREEEFLRWMEDEEEERARDLPGAVAARLGGAGSVRGLPSCRGLMLRLAVSWGILRVVSGLPAGPGGSFLVSGGWEGADGGQPPKLGPVLKRTARLSPKKE